MDGSNNFLLARLEESILNVGKSNIDDFVFDCTVPETVQVAFQGSLCLLGSNTRPSIQISQNRSLAFIQIDPLLLHNIFLSMLLTHLHSDLLLEGFDLPLEFTHPVHLLTPKHDFLHEDRWLHKFGELESRDRVRKMEVKPE